MSPGKNKGKVWWPQWMVGFQATILTLMSSPKPLPLPPLVVSRWIGLALVLGLSWGAIPHDDGTPVPLRAGELHAHDYELAAGDFLQVVVEQHAVDVVVRLLDPDGGELMRVDGPSGDQGSEELVAVVPAAGRYRVEVVAPDEVKAGHYTLRTIAQRPATAADRELVAADRAYHGARRLIAQGAARQAIDELLPVLECWRRLGLRRRQADTLDELSRAHLKVGAPQAAVEHGEKAVDLYRRLGAERRLAVSLDRVGFAYLRLGDPGRADEPLQEARTLFEVEGNERGLAATLSHLGTVHHRLGRIQRALDYFEPALEKARTIGRARLEASILTDMGGILLALHRPQEAVDAYARAQRIYQRLDRTKDLASATRGIAGAHLQLGDPQRAEDAVREAVTILYGSEDLRSRALALITLGHVRRLRADQAGARKAFENALTLARRAEDAHTETVALTGLGHLEVLSGNPQRGLALHDQALTLATEIGDRKRQATSRVRGAEALRDLGRLEAAWQRLAPALDQVEELRDATPRRDYRLSYFAFRQEYYEIACDVLMRLHERQPAAGYDARAFALNERRLARELLDALAVDSGDGEEVAPIDLATARKTLLDAGSLLLAYALGEERSTLWAITAHRQDAYVLPARPEIESRTREFATALGWLQESNQQERARRGRELSAVLLAPVAAQLARHRRLIIVADGELRTIPFAALPPPDTKTEDAFLIESHEIVILPSLSTLAARRRLAAALPPPEGTIAVFADPVFSADDPRVRRAAGAGEPESAPATVRGGPLRGGPLRRLVRSREEAEAIIESAGGDRYFLALDFAASRESFLSTELSDYGVLHFATHALLDRQPESSGLVLSLVDERGHGREGFLRTHEIAALDLPVELVVLSACQSGVGEKVRGEGMLGLAWGFLHAGAARVIASLWEVSDRWTARLMTAFYTAYLAAETSPAAALRQAQLELVADPQSRPADWAAFIFQGDWRRPE